MLKASVTGNTHCSQRAGLHWWDRQLTGQHSSSSCRVHLHPRKGSGAGCCRHRSSTHQLLRRHPQDTELFTHRLFRGQFGISCFYSLGQKLISSKEKQSQTIASKLCMRRRAHCSITDRKQPLVLLLCADMTIPLQRLTEAQRTTKERDKTQGKPTYKPC